MNGKALLVGGALATGVAILGGLTAGCGRTKATAAAAAETRAVNVESVREEQLQRTVDVVGTLAALEEVTVSSEAEGKVARILADLGDRVTAGQILVELDQEKAQYKVDQQRAALDRAMAAYGVTSAEGALPAIEQTPDVQKAAAELAQVRLAFERAQELTKRSLLPKQQLDDADATLKTKQAGYDSSLQSARNLRAEIDAARANLRLAERELRDSNIRAPFEAYVQSRAISPGEFVRVQTTVMTLVKIHPLRLLAEVPERMAPWVKIGQPLSLTVDAMPDTNIKGTIARISPAANKDTRAFPLEGEVPNADGLLKPGTFARVHIVTDHIERIRTVPSQALQYRYGVNRVFVVNGDKLVSKEIRIGDRLGERVEVLEGVTSGETIVVSDVDKLTDGLSVTVAHAEGD